MGMAFSPVGVSTGPMRLSGGARSGDPRNRQVELGHDGRRVNDRLFRQQFFPGGQIGPDYTPDQGQSYKRRQVRHRSSGWIRLRSSFHVVKDKTSRRENHRIAHFAQRRLRGREIRRRSGGERKRRSVFRSFDDVILEPGAPFGQQPVGQHLARPLDGQIGREDPYIGRRPHRAVLFRQFRIE